MAKELLHDLFIERRVPKSVVRHTFGLVRPRTGHFQDLLDRTMENVVRPGTDDVGPWSAKFVVGIITKLGNPDLPNLIICLQQILCICKLIAQNLHSFYLRYTNK